MGARRTLRQATRPEVHAPHRPGARLRSRRRVCRPQPHRTWEVRTASDRCGDTTTRARRVSSTSSTRTTATACARQPRSCIRWCSTTRCGAPLGPDTATIHPRDSIHAPSPARAAHGALPLYLRAILLASAQSEGTMRFLTHAPELMEPSGRAQTQRMSRRWAGRLWPRPRRPPRATPPRPRPRLSLPMRCAGAGSRSSLSLRTKSTCPTRSRPTR